ncbi:hypothetical protein FDECE_15567 [Fusarium decemcellulare]|nr:hypothetical protein FDECE_15567 [Fusarium decemcellulare]
MIPEASATHLDRIKSVNPMLNGIVTLNAKEADHALASGDSIEAAGIPAQRSSPIFRARIPETDAISVARIKASGGLLPPKTNLPEFSCSNESDNLLIGRSHNSWNLDRTAVASSSGESVAIAAGLSPLGLGTDLAISVRGPAAQAGIVALKATHGRVPMTGIWPRTPRRF